MAGTGRENGTSTTEACDKNVGAVLLTEAVIRERVAELGAELTRAYAGKSPVLVVVLKGSYIFAADLSRALGVAHSVEFIRARSYQGTESSGTVTITGLSEVDLTGQHVVIVEDIVDTGLTIKEISRKLSTLGAKSVSTVTFVLKRTRRRLSDTPPVDYHAFELPDKFIVGYGLDVDQRLRHLPYVAVYKGT